MSNNDSSLKELEEKFRKQPADTALGTSLAEDHFAAGNLNRAKEVLDKIIKENESAGPALVLRAELLAERRDWVGAERDCRMARKAGGAVPWKLYLKSAYFRRLMLASKGWRPEKLGRIISLLMCSATGALMVGMGIRLLAQCAYLGFLLSFIMGVGFFIGGAMVGGLSLWLKSLQDKLTPGWDAPPTLSKKK